MLLDVHKDALKAMVGRALRITPCRLFCASVASDFSSTAMSAMSPPHVHVESGDGYAKVWLTPIGLAQWVGFDARAVRDLLSIVTQHRDELEQAWHDHFGT